MLQRRLHLFLKYRLNYLNCGSWEEWLLDTLKVSLLPLNL
ncbi:hypothetical protein CY0110_17522 [Crocosphaera chwakensis CCY0110]|uniref:Uncharacterized protein n=1 Tax=Crocosphaera chwakensis CCY0110 TaxID=391612 RepID=A3III6_9CHRO|nr:hypothetical protein CY0110_17522 [Crocosphaera chwakensis CCY0110]